MKMTTRIAYENMKYHKSKNILIGIAVFDYAIAFFSPCNWCEYN